MRSDWIYVWDTNRKTWRAYVRHQNIDRSSNKDWITWMRLGFYLKLDYDWFVIGED